MATAIFIDPDNIPGVNDSPFTETLVHGLQFTGSAVTYYLTGVGWNLNNAEQALVGALDAWGAVADIQFSETSSPLSADWNIDLYTGPTQGELGAFYFPNNSGLGGEFNSNHVLYSAINNLQGGFSFVTFLHEIGHGLGLNHPFLNDPDYPPFPGVTAGDSNDVGDFNFNNGFYTVMSYLDDPWFAVAPGYSYGYAGTPMAFDVAAVQAIYGPNLTTATGDDVYLLPTANASGTFWTTIWDVSGTDTISGAANGGGVTIDLRAATLQNEEGGGGRPSWQSGIDGSVIYGGFAIANGVVIENAIGSAHDDDLTGNDAVNEITGGAGDDTIYALGGIDMLTGGNGADTFVYASYTDADAAVGIEQILDFTTNIDKVDLSALTIESYSITQTGSEYLLQATTALGTLSLNITATGGFDEDDIIGTLPEGADQGTENADTLNGTNGDDVMNGLGGNDTINGLDGNDELYGDAGVDALFGNDGDDTLDGGLGSDTMTGGAGDDIYYANTGSDVWIETSGTNGGIDTVHFSGNVTSIGSSVENLILAGNSLHATGNSSDNEITGNHRNNNISGNGGNDLLEGHDGNDQLNGNSGDDTMIGGDGDDRYSVDSAGDIVQELAGEGTDIVRSQIDYILGDFVENGQLLGSVAQDLTGNALNNSLTGNNSANFLYGEDGDDYLDGRGGGDFLDGGAGLDTYRGSTGQDIFYYDEGDFAGAVLADSKDTIRDFDTGEGDQIDLSDVDAITGGADDAFSFIGTSTFSGVAGELRYDQIGASTYIFADTNGDGVSDLSVRLSGTHTLAASDFIL